VVPTKVLGTQFLFPWTTCWRVNTSGRQAVDARAFVEDALRVLGCQGLDAAAAEAHPIARRSAGLNHDVIDPPFLVKSVRIADHAPLPISAMASSDPTPMMMPSVVSAERMALRRSERRGGRGRADEEPQIVARGPSNLHRGNRCRSLTD